jgi:plasmid stabilization system protein ParE
VRIRLDAAADDELAAVTAAIDAAREGHGVLFGAEVDAAGKQLVNFPRSGQMLRGGFRRILLDRFPYQLVYRVEGDEIVIYAVAHQKRRPGYWRKRVAPKG